MAYLNKKKSTLFIGLTSLLFTFSTYTTHAQVTIGIGEEAERGTLLQLKNIAGVQDDGPNSTMGLSAPRVQLTTTTELTDITPEGNDSNGNPITLDKKAHTGVIVYCPKPFGEDYCQGMYIWNGEEWSPLAQGTGNYDPEVKTFRDFEGNVYAYKRFGDKDWMTQDLRSTTEYAEGITNLGTVILNNNGRKGPTASAALIKVENGIIPVGTATFYTINAAKKTQKHQMSYHDLAKMFGLGYNQKQAVKACPRGWELPTLADWLALSKIFDPSGVLEHMSENNKSARFLKANNLIYLEKENSIPNDINKWGGLSACEDGFSNFNAYPSGQCTTSGCEDFGEQVLYRIKGDGANLNDDGNKFIGINRGSDKNGNSIMYRDYTAPWMNYYFYLSHYHIRCIRDSQ